MPAPGGQVHLEAKLIHEDSGTEPRGAMWRKSTRSGEGTNNCVEVCLHNAVVFVRDSKDQEGPILRFEATAWEAFLGSLKATARL
jgi:hypothetical protein